MQNAEIISGKHADCECKVPVLEDFEAVIWVHGVFIKI